MNTVTADTERVHVRSGMHLTATWTRFELATWFREPAAVILNIAYPLIMLAFFVVAFEPFRTNSEAAMTLVSALPLVGVLMVSLNFPATGIPEARESDFYTYARTLPAGAGPRITAWIITPMICGFISAVLTVTVGFLVTAANPSLSDIAVILAGALVLSLPMTLIGMALGFILNKRSALAVSLAVAFTMILAGGVSGFPLPDWVDAIAQYLPPGATATLVSDALTGNALGVWPMTVLAVWTAAGLIASIVLYRRDEGRNFR